MKSNEVEEELKNKLGRMPAIDVHTHLDASHLSARGLADIMLYHMVVCDLKTAGCPGGERVSERPDRDEEAARIEEAIPYLPYIKNTSCWWLVRIILSELYGWNEPITADNWRELDERIRKKSSDDGWAREILSRANVKRACTEYVKRADGRFDDVLFYGLEWAFFARAQWGMFDAPLYELECAWAAKAPAAPLAVTIKDRKSAGRQIRTVADVKEAMKNYCSKIPYGEVVSAVQHISTDINFRSVSDNEMQAALGKRSEAGATERDVYASYLLETFLSELEKRSDEIAFQFSLGAEPLAHGTASRLNQRSIKELAEIVGRHPDLRFMCFLSNRHGNQSLCTLCRELPNLSLAGYWWHNFFPGIMEQVIDERLDMLSVNRQVAFFSDAYCVEWTYAKSKLVRRLLAGALSRRVERNQFTFDEALEIAGIMLLDTPRSLLGVGD